MNHGRNGMWPYRVPIVGDFVLMVTVTAHPCQAASPIPYANMSFVIVVL